MKGAKGLKRAAHSPPPRGPVPLALGPRAPGVTFSAFPTGLHLTRFGELALFDGLQAHLDERMPPPEAWTRRPWGREWESTITISVRAVRQECFDCGCLWPEGFMVRNELWAAACAAGAACAGATGPEMILCLHCTEKRLGRRVVRADLTEAPINRAAWIERALSQKYTVAPLTTGKGPV